MKKNILASAIPELDEVANDIILDFFDIPSLLANSEKLPINSILEKICVSPPYFAFKEIYRYKEFLIAPVIPEQPIGNEITPISSAEASRHLAILGSIVLAFKEEEKKYYLATKAVKKIGDSVDKNTLDKATKLYAVAVPVSSATRRVSARTFLVTEKGEIIFTFYIEFSKFSEKLFERFFSEHLAITRQVNYNPHAEIIELKDIIIKDNRLTAKLPTIKPEKCAGHFDNAPMLPVGILSYILINTIGKLWSKIEGGDSNIKYYLFSADMTLFAPTNIHREEIVEIDFLGKNGNIYNFSWLVKTQTGEPLNEMKISFVLSV